MKIKIICKECNKEYETQKCWTTNNRGKFCSKKCEGIWRSKNIIGKNHPNWIGGKIKILCRNCGKEKYVVSSQIKYGWGKFCSKKCMNNDKYSSLWKGGITPILTQIRQDNKYKQWRQQIFLRDTFTCQQCGQKGGQLEAHHIKPFHKFIEEIKDYLPLIPLYEAAMLYTPLWDLNNGITLCKKCHNKINKRR